MQHDVFAIARGCQKTIELPVAAYRLLNQTLGNRSKSHRLHHRPDLSCHSRLLNLRLMLKSQIQCRQSGWRIAQSIKLSDASSQDKLIGKDVHAPG